MRYNIKRWYEHESEDEHNKKYMEELEDCDQLEVVKPVIKAIDYAQNFEAIVNDSEKNIRTFIDKKIDKSITLNYETVRVT